MIYQDIFVNFGNSLISLALCKLHFSYGYLVKFNTSYLMT